MKRIGIKLVTLWIFLVFFVAIAAASPSWSSTLKVGFYRYKCPSAEAVVRQTVRNHVARNPGFAPGLVRMHFHDCFVRGCDASILLDSIPGIPSEKESPANNPSLRGFEVIYEAKARLESICPSTVSCADILTFAARDAAYLAGGINYAVPSGRRDGRISLKSDVFLHLPPPSFNASQLISNFMHKGLTGDEMVTLSGAHSFGVSHCSSFSNRLYNFNSTHGQDPTLDSLFAMFLKISCPRVSLANGRDPVVNMDFFTPHRLDNVYYTNLQYRRGLFASDQTLYDSPSMRRVVEDNAKRTKVWSDKFGKAMVRMGGIEVLTGMQGEIRRNCRVVN